ncbi:HD domain-containing protein [Actinomadura rugatobispora]|uniref:HD domain-containing protein n=1 Tax=Actinomadura rugatobispora TaxID=1994 RepID=A0ABW1ACP9_9ACTN
MKKNTAAWASDLARSQLEIPLPRRWAHTQGVAHQARTLAPLLGENADLLEAAAWLHDIGYAPGLISTGFHPLDGARYLRQIHDTHEQLSRLVAHHSCALVEAHERGLAHDLIQEFGSEPPSLSVPLTYCDMTTGPGGDRLSVEERISEVLARYGNGHIVAKAIQVAHPTLVGSVQVVHQSLLISQRTA